MEHLTKAQIVLLTMFVSFVASMATGVVVVTLMQQSPEPVTQTITNVVEKTIEKIVPTTIEKPGKTVIVKDEDLVIAAVEKNSKSTVALRYLNQNGDRVPMGIGTVVSAEGLIITDKHNFDNGLLSATVSGMLYTVEVVANSQTSSLVLGRLMPVAPSATSTPPVTFTPISFGSPGSLKIGQTALALGGRDAKSVVAGLVAGLDTHTVTDKETKAETTLLDSIIISQRLAGTSNGAPIITLDGNVVGFVSIDENIGSQVGIPATEAANLIAAAAQKKTEKK